MPQSEILCTCGKRFAVQDGGEGTPHECPSCGMLNVLPREALAGSVMSRDAGAETAVQATQILSGLEFHQSASNLPEGTTLGAYRIVGQIGRGGMGAVYEAIDESQDMRVALKVLSPDLAQKKDFVQRFHRESKILAGISDPRIAKVYFSGAIEGLPFFAMELIDGKNLEEILEDDGPFATDEAVKLMAQASAGLAAAATRGLVHRDVKPTNLIRSADGSLRIVDFGLAKSMDSETQLTLTGAVIGTPYYVSPEQGLGKEADHRSDIYSLGATFYHLLVGDVPFGGESPVAIIMNHVNQPLAPLTEQKKGVSEPLARVVMRCMAKDPDQRYQDYEDLTLDLESIQAGNPVTAPPEHVHAHASSSRVVVDDSSVGARVLQLASRKRRGFALLIDLLCLVSFGQGLLKMMPDSAVLLSLFIWLGVGFSYLLFLDGIKGQTLGKRLFQLRVARPDGSAPGLGRALLRSICGLPFLFYLLKTIGNQDDLIGLYGGNTGFDWTLVPGLIVLADLATSFFTEKKRSFHDVLSGTSVFREKPAPKVRKRRRSEEFFARKGRNVPRPWAVVVAGIVPGMGQLLNGELGKAAVFFFGIVFTFSTTFVVGLVIWAISIFEARSVAVRRFRESQDTSSTES